MSRLTARKPPSNSAPSDQPVRGEIDPIKFVSNINGVISDDNQYGLYAGAAYSPFAANRGFQAGFVGGGAGAFNRPRQSSINPAVTARWPLSNSVVVVRRSAYRATVRSAVRSSPFPA
jgi:hypothetical protein